MKAILVIDLPEEYIGSVIDVKLYSEEKVVHEHYVNKLKPLPQKKNTDFHPNVVYANGWNDCLEELK